MTDSKSRFNLIGGEAISDNGSPGEFFVVGMDLVLTETSAYFEKLLSNEDPYEVAMGLWGLSQKVEDYQDILKSFFADERTVALATGACDICVTTLGEFARQLTENRNLLACRPRL